MNAWAGTLGAVAEWHAPVDALHVVMVWPTPRKRLSPLWVQPYPQTVPGRRIEDRRATEYTFSYGEATAPYPVSTVAKRPSGDRLTKSSAEIGTVRKCRPETAFTMTAFVSWATTARPPATSGRVDPGTPWATPMCPVRQTTTRVLSSVPT